MTSKTTTAAPTRYEGKVSKTLKQWCDRHPGMVIEISHEDGFTFGTGYDVLIAPGHTVNVSGDWLHTIIEPTVATVLAVLKTIRPCHDDDECRAHWAAVKTGGAKYDSQPCHLCGTECSTHPDAANPLARCGDCGGVTCLDHRVDDAAQRCNACAAVFYAEQSASRPTSSRKAVRVALRETGETGIVIKTINKCLWVQMDDGREMSGAARHWRRVVPHGTGQAMARKEGGE